MGSGAVASAPPRPDLRKTLLRDCSTLGRVYERGLVDVARVLARAGRHEVATAADLSGQAATVPDMGWLHGSPSFISDGHWVLPAADVGVSRTFPNGHSAKDREWYAPRRLYVMEADTDDLQTLNRAYSFTGPTRFTMTARRSGINSRRSTLDVLKHAWATGCSIMNR